MTSRKKPLPPPEIAVDRLPYWNEELPSKIIGATILRVGWNPDRVGYLLIEYRPREEAGVMRAQLGHDDRGMWVESTQDVSP